MGLFGSFAMTTRRNLARSPNDEDEANSPSLRRAGGAGVGLRGPLSSSAVSSSSTTISLDYQVCKEGSSVDSISVLCALCLDVVFDGEGDAFAAVEDVAQDVDDEDEDDEANAAEDEVEVAMHEAQGGVEDGGAVDDDEDGLDEETQELAGGDGEEVGEDAHLEDAGGELKEFDRHGRGAHGGEHDCEELLFFKAVAEALEAVAVDALEQEELAAGAAEIVGQQAADGGADRGHEAVEQDARVAGDAVADDERIEEGQGDGGGIDDGEGKQAPDAEGLQYGEHDELDLDQPGTNFGPGDAEEGGGQTGCSRAGGGADQAGPPVGAGAGWAVRPCS